MKLVSLSALLLFISNIINISSGNAQPRHHGFPSSKPLTDSCWQYMGAPGISDGVATGISLIFDEYSSGLPYLAFVDVEHGNHASVVKYDWINSTWDYVGIPGFTPGPVDYLSLNINYYGTPYIAFQDASNSWKVSVMKFDGTNWVLVGLPGISSGAAAYTSVSFDDAQLPYVAYQDNGYSGKLCIRKYTGTMWVTIGNPGISDGVADNIKMAGTYVAYKDYAYGGAVTVRQLEGIDWKVVGMAGFSGGTADYISFCLGNFNSPYVAFMDGSNSGRATVMTFKSGNWVTVGTPGFSPGMAPYTSLAIGYPNTPYVAFQDYPDSLNATLMKFDGTDWVTYGSPDFSDGNAYSTSLAIQSNGVPWVAYADSAFGFKAVVMRYENVPEKINDPKEIRFSLYPNPATTSIILEQNNAGAKLTSANILDGMGRKISEIQLSGTKTLIHVENYPAGVYFVKIRTEFGDRVVKFCKE